ncbi:peptidyl-prolyl cis-trans isomerase [Actinomadura verrucosospora]|uniref:Peptidyl-prolyl cis-trans isomerase n=2 Tax=Actinomadura verrucosospora TaxID=46165 RepID=A0A7D3W2W6_ACTVE|nr:peptidyl-prolyl cis-trans isomerase [Actinomadura verrucosospora]
MGHYPPPPPPMPAEPAYGSGASQDKTNGLAIAAFVTGLLGCCGIVGAVLGFISLRQIGDRGGKGRGLAIAGIVLSALWIVGGVVGYLVIPGSDSASSATGADGTPKPKTTKPEKIDAYTMKVGDCINDPASSGAPAGESAPPVEVESVKKVPCTGPHDGEVLAVFKLTQAVMPTDQQMSRLASTGCKLRIQRKLDRDPAAANLGRSFYYPTADSWRDGDRAVTCLAVNAAEGKKLTRPIRG